MDFERQFSCFAWLKMANTISKIFYFGKKENTASGPTIIELVVSDTGSKIQAACFDNGVGLPINLSGSIVTLRWYDQNGISTQRIMTIIDSQQGIAEYLFNTNEIFYPQMNFEVTISDATGKEITSTSVVKIKARRRIT